MPSSPSAQFASTSWRYRPASSRINSSCWPRCTSEPPSSTTIRSQSPDGAQAVGDDEAGAATAAQAVVDAHFGDGVQGAGGFVQNQHRRVVHQRPGDLQPLPLAAAEVASVLFHRCVVAERPGRRSRRVSPRPGRRPPRRCPARPAPTSSGSSARCRRTGRCADPPATPNSSAGRGESPRAGSRRTALRRPTARRCQPPAPTAWTCRRRWGRRRPPAGPGSMARLKSLSSGSGLPG